MSSLAKRDELLRYLGVVIGRFVVRHLRVFLSFSEKLLVQVAFLSALELIF